MFLLYASIYFLYGIVIGSFLNVLIYRIPSGLSFVKGRSMCTNCQTTLQAKDLIPLLSWLSLKGRCRYCQQQISPQYPLVELLTGCLYVLAFMVFGATTQSILSALVFSILIVISGIDLQTQEIPDQLNGLLLLLAIGSLCLPHTLPLSQHLIGLLCVSVPLFFVALITGGGIGGGDIKLMAATGLLLGWPKILLAFLIGCVTAALVSVVLLATHKVSRKSTIALGPFLSLGIVIATLWGEPIIQWYLQILLH